MLNPLLVSSSSRGSGNMWVMVSEGVNRGDGRSSSKTSSTIGVPDDLVVRRCVLVEDDCSAGSVMVSMEMRLWWVCGLVDALLAVRSF